MESMDEIKEDLWQRKDAKIRPTPSKALLGEGQLFNDEESLTLKDRCWGLWSTMGLTATIGILYLLTAGMVAGFLYGFGLAANPDLDSKVFFDSLLKTNFFLSLATLTTALTTVGLIILFVAFRKGITIREYLDFNPVSYAVILRWLAITLVFLLMWDAVYSLLGLVESDFVVKLYNSPGNKILFWVAMVIAAPVAEEFFFRGFLFEGIRSSKLGTVGAILITSVFWGLIHQQYGVPEMVLLISFGVLLGIAKLKTRSIYTPIALHSGFNLLAMAQVAAMS